jgi:hypothetical protein
VPLVKDDYRIRIEVDDENAGGLLERLGLGLSGEAADLASDLEARRLVVSRDGDDLFVYAASYAEAENARSVIQAELRDNDIAAVTGPVERWLDEDDRWSDEPPSETWEEEAIERGFAPWEVRVQMTSHGDARDLGDRLEQEGFAVERRWRYLIVGTATKEEADALAARVHGEVEPGGELVWETVPGNPFAVFGGMGGSGAPIG